MMLDAKPRDSMIAAESFLLVAPAPANDLFFENFTHVVNDYLEQPPFNFVNKLGLVKQVIAAASYTTDSITH